jgi:hypothetical protein
MAEHWLRFDQNPLTSRAVANAPPDAAAKMFSSRLEFGTAGPPHPSPPHPLTPPPGLRGPMGPGLCAMNDVVVIQTTQGLIARLLQDGRPASAHSLVVGFDHRAAPQWGISSRGMAVAIAAVALHAGVRAFLFDGLVSTPTVPFAVTRLRASAGVMVTASHNPKEDNGYKLYWENGTPPPFLPALVREGVKSSRPSMGRWRN